MAERCQGSGSLQQRLEFYFGYEWTVALRLFLFIPLSPFTLAPSPLHTLLALAFKLIGKRRGRRE